MKTPITNETVLKLIARNNAEHHIFYNNGLHNHFPHVLLSKYALGATDAQLNEQFEYEHQYLEPLKVEQKIRISENNWFSHLGDESFYANYLDFFRREIINLGRDPVMLKYFFKEETFPSVFSGALHPLIHIGFGIEFESEDVLAEGLALMCVQKPTAAPMLLFLKESPPKKDDLKTITPLLQMIRNDNSIDSILPGTTENKLKTTIEKLPDKINYYAKILRFDAHDEHGFLRYLQIAIETSIQLYSATVFNPSFSEKAVCSHIEAAENIKPDFFLLHGLTSSLALLEIISHLNNEQKAKVVLILSSSFFFLLSSIL